MKCPFCAEEIKDEALVCRYCKQNLMSFREVNDRLSQLEDQLSDLASSLERIQSSIHLPIIDASHHRETFVTKVGTIGLSVLVVVGCYSLVPLVDLIERAQRSSSPALAFVAGLLLTISIAFPFLLGIWRRIKAPEAELRKLIFTGLAIGGISGLGNAIIFLFVEGLEAASLMGSLYTLILWMLSGTLLYTGGGIIGNWIHRKRAPFERESGYAVRLAKKVVGNKQKSSDERTRVKPMAEVIGALGPILTLLGSVITAVLAYKAASNK